MLKSLILLTGLLAAPVSAADGVTIEVHNFTVANGIAKAVIRVRNNLNAPIKNVFIDCAFLNSKKKAVGIGKANVSSIEANADTYEDAALVTQQEVKFVDCRVKSFD